MLKSLYTFYRSLLKRPREMGSVIPSSPYLAKAIASFVPKDQQGFILELGPGTGIITQGLLKAGFNEQQLILIENGPRLAKQLQKRFLSAEVIFGDAEHIQQYLSDEQQPITAVVSSLPLVSLSKQTTQNILQQIESVLADGGVFIQFTYAQNPVWEQHLTQLKRIAQKKIWRNIPPAQVLVYRKPS